MAEKSPPKHRDWSSRAKRPSPVGSTIFVGLRAADAALQYALLGQKLGSELVKLLGGQPVVTSTINGPLGLTPHGAIVAVLAMGSTLKQSIWCMFLKEQEMTVGAAFVIAGLETVLNTANTLLSAWALTSAAPASRLSHHTVFDSIFASPTLIAGLSLSAVGLTTELFSEFQRKSFKKNPKNKGKPYGGGLWSLATNINYGGYTLWRAGYATAAAGPIWGGLAGVFFIYDFMTRAIPSLDQYCTEK
ncbi:MAG: hypothetical protein Q9190_006900, partial [Brigantiaea leucoxantha]